MLKKEIATELILETVFGRSSDLYMELYEEGLIDNSFDAETDLARAYGFTLVGGESRDPEKVYARVRERLERLMREGIPAGELERARKVLISGNIRTFNSVERMGNSFIRQIFAGFNPLTFGETVAQVTDEAVMNRLREHFDTENCVLSVVSPAEA